MATNKSLKNDLKDMGEKIITNFNILDDVKCESNTKQEFTEDTNKVQTSTEAGFKQDEAINQIKGKDLINKGKIMQ
ncbi:hypothetical protein [Clostridium sp.]|uniref:hypothetical protein n=1 Tax=Clostridium sp. TaxID=1506 RepID=UPI00284DDF79|nr:hypothetical protein [Clostridium sp.]MDR3594356.1 hypothetical protein [Clostridium sp.]